MIDRGTTLKGWTDPNEPRLTVYRADFTHHRFSSHFHDEWTLAVNEVGTGGFSYRGNSYRPEPDEIVLFRPGEVHDGYPVAGLPWRLHGLRVENELVREFLGRRRLPASPLVRHPEAARALVRLSKEAEARRGAGFSDAVGAVLLRLAGSDGEPRRAPASRVPHGVRRVLRRIRDYPTEPLSLEAMAQIAGLSKSHFSRRFKQAVGLTPHRYQIQARLCLSERLLKRGWSLPILASYLGFADQSHFGRHHKERTGLPPREYERHYLRVSSPLCCEGGPATAGS